jgi:hypothetical protein
MVTTAREKPSLSSLAVAGKRLATADIPLPLCCRTDLALSCQHLTLHNCKYQPTQPSFVATGGQSASLMPSLIWDPRTRFPLLSVAIWLILGVLSEDTPSLLHVVLLTLASAVTRAECRWDSCLLQPGRPCPRLYITEEHCGPVIHPMHVVPFSSLPTTHRATEKIFKPLLLWGWLCLTISLEGLHRRRLFHYYMFSRCQGKNVSTELLPSNSYLTVACLHSCYLVVGLHDTACCKTIKELGPCVESVKIHVSCKAYI